MQGWVINELLWLSLTQNLAIYYRSVKTLSTVMSYSVFRLFYPLVGPNTEPYPSSYLLQTCRFLVPLKSAGLTLLATQSALGAHAWLGFGLLVVPSPFF